MDAYLFTGTILPERAQLTLQNSRNFVHLASGVGGGVRVSILNNQLAVWVESDHEWDIFDLRNLVKTWVQNQLAMVGFVLGYAYEIEISRVLHQQKSIDYVFGIDIPCLASRNTEVDVVAELERLDKKCFGPKGVFLHRCFTDLAFAMKHADDTGFYCYRALESLVHHCMVLEGIPKSKKKSGWETFREKSGSSEELVYSIKDAADPLRHGEATSTTANARETMLVSTWDIVTRYLNNLPESPSPEVLNAALPPA